MIKSGFLELKRSLHPSVIIKPRYNGSILEQNIIHNIYSFFILYILLFIFGALFFTAIGLDFKSAFGVSAASLGNVGPAIGEYGPSSSYSSLPILGKYMASFLMIFGRLELFTVLVIFTPYFWKNR